MTMRLRAFAILGVTGVLMAAAPLLAHHSFAAEYDAKKPIELKGTITKVDWMNPHVYFYIDVKDEGGKIANWAFEMGPPRLLERGGWKKSTMKEGDEVIVSGTLAKDGGKHGNARSVTLANTGQKLGGASSEGTIP
jgi:exonuclease VII large subunit